MVDDEDGVAELLDEVEEVRAEDDGGAVLRAPDDLALRLQDELAADLMGQRGGALTALAIAISTLGFLSQGMLTAPRVYYAMAEDGLFFRSVGFVAKRTQVPVVAIALQGVLAIVIALSGRYDQILNYVISSDFIFFGLTAGTLFVFRARQAREEAPNYKVPGHPWTTALFVAASALIVAGTVYTHPKESFTGWLILATGFPVYWFWRSKNRRRADT